MSGMPTWEEWNEQLTEEQRKYSLYKILESANKRLDHCPEQIEKCDMRFGKIERKRWTHVTASAIGGFFGGIAAVVGKWVFFK